MHRSIRPAKSKSLAQGATLTPNLVDLGGQNKIVLAQAIDVVCPRADLYLPPAQQYVGMVLLFLCNPSNLHHKGKRRAKIGKFEVADDAVVFAQLPVRDHR